MGLAWGGAEEVRDARRGGGGMILGLARLTPTDGYIERAVPIALRSAHRLPDGMDTSKLQPRTKTICTKVVYRGYLPRVYAFGHTEK